MLQQPNERSYWLKYAFNGIRKGGGGAKKRVPHPIPTATVFLNNLKYALEGIEKAEGLGSETNNHIV